MTSEDHNTIFTAPSGEAHIFVFESGGSSFVLIEREGAFLTDSDSSDSNPSSSLFDDNPKFEEYIVREPRQGTRIVYVFGLLFCVHSQLTITVLHFLDQYVLKPRSHHSKYQKMRFSNSNKRTDLVSSCLIWHILSGISLAMPTQDMEA